MHLWKCLSLFDHSHLFASWVSYKVYFLVVSYKQGSQIPVCRNIISFNFRLQFFGIPLKCGFIWFADKVCTLLNLTVLTLVCRLFWYFCIPYSELGTYIGGISLNILYKFPPCILQNLLSESRNGSSVPKCVLSSVRCFRQNTKPVYEQPFEISFLGAFQVLFI